MTIVRRPEAEVGERPGHAAAPPEPAARPDDDLDIYSIQGESVDEETARRLQLTFQAVNKFPDFVKRHRRFVGGATATAVISTTALVLAYRALGARMAKGESPGEALKGVTEEEMDRSMALLRKIRRNKK